MKKKLEKIREIRRNRIFIEKLLSASQTIGRSQRSGFGNYIVTSPEIAKNLNMFNLDWIKENILGTQSDE
jgi:hypothetical protein